MIGGRASIWSALGSQYTPGCDITFSMYHGDEVRRYFVTRLEIAREEDGLFWEMFAISLQDAWKDLGDKWIVGDDDDDDDDR